MTQEELTELPSWVALINIGILVASTLAAIALRGTIREIHATLFRRDEEDLGGA